jgi:hypothetical protein
MYHELQPRYGNLPLIKIKRIVDRVRFSENRGSVEILFFLYSFIPCGSLENDPLSPPEGEATQGEYPLDPLFFWDVFQPYQELSQ